MHQSGELEDLLEKSKIIPPIPPKAELWFIYSAQINYMMYAHTKYKFPHHFTTYMH